MKKLFLLVTIAATSIFTFAQDIIVTKDSKKIDAKILEVSKSEIKYKELDNLEGPTFVLDVAEINSVIYSNGKVVLYDQNTANTSREAKTSAESLPNKLDVDIEDGDRYVSEEGTVVLVYDKEKKLMYLHTNKPLMHNSYDVRNITLTMCHFGNKQMTLIFDLANKVNGVAILSGIHTFMSNLDFQRYFKKHMPKEFVIDIPYETQQESYQVKLININVYNYNLMTYLMKIIHLI